MALSQELEIYDGLPLTHQVLMTMLNGYKRPNDKIHHLLKDGLLQPVKKGLYTAGPATRSRKPEPFLLANHILGPSYISLDAALSFYGMIPERVFEISSMTTKASRTFKTPVGVFSFTKLPLPYYAFGITRLKLNERQFALVASPEKAIFDKVVATKGIIFRSKKDAADYLMEDLRMDEDRLMQLDIHIMESWLADAPKKDSLSLMIKMISAL